MKNNWELKPQELFKNILVFFVSSYFSKNWSAGWSQEGWVASSSTGKKLGPRHGLWCYNLKPMGRVTWNPKQRVPVTQQNRPWSNKRRQIVVYLPSIVNISGMENRRFMLKAVHHLLNLDALMEVFPGAQLIFTHRKLTQVIPSWLSLTELMCYQYGGVPDEQWKRRLVPSYCSLLSATQSFIHWKDTEIWEVPNVQVSNASPVCPWSFYGVWQW